MKLMRNMMLCLPLALGLGFAGGVHAHSDEYLETVKAPNGGQLRMAGAYHYELVIKPASGGTTDVLVYVTGHDDAPVDVKGTTGTVTVLSKGKSTITLKPDGKNLMRGTGTFEHTPALKAVVSITLPGEQAEQARFAPFAKAQQGHKH